NMILSFDVEDNSSLRSRRRLNDDVGPQLLTARFEVRILAGDTSMVRPTVRSGSATGPTGCKAIVSKIGARTPERMPERIVVVAVGVGVRTRGRSGLSTRLAVVGVGDGADIAVSPAKAGVPGVAAWAKTTKLAASAAVRTG